MRLALPCLLLALAALAGISSEARARNESTRTEAPDRVLDDGKTWGIDLALGLMLYGGNTEQEILDGKLKLFRRWGDTTGYVTASENFVQANGLLIQKTAQITVRADQKISDDWKLFAYTTHGMNSNLLADYVGQVGAGPWIELRAWGISHGLSLAAAYQYERYATGDSARVIRTAFRYLFKARLDEGVEAGFDFFFAPTPRDFNDLRIAFFPFLETPIVKERLSLALNGGIEYDRQPLPGVRTTDRKFVTSLKFHLGE